MTNAPDDRAAFDIGSILAERDGDGEQAHEFGPGHAKRVEQSRR